MKKSDPVSATFEQLPMLLERDAALITRGRLLDVDCLLGSTEQATTSLSAPAASPI